MSRGEKSQSILCLLVFLSLHPPLLFHVTPFSITLSCRERMRVLPKHFMPRLTEKDLRGLGLKETKVRQRAPPLLST